MTDPDRRRSAPAALRNRPAIKQVLETVLPAHGTVLEIASGSGDHAVYFAEHFPHLIWQPSDMDADARASILAWAQSSSLPNLRPPLALDATMSAQWPDLTVAAMLCINMVHISPWAASQGLFAAAGRLLLPGAPLMLYGPYIHADRETAPSNLAFDADLKRRNPAWGLRAVADLDALALANGLERRACHRLPANNDLLVYRRH